MRYAAITGWGKCMPPAVLSNADLSTFLHELSHGWLEEMKADAARTDAPADIRAADEAAEPDAADPDS